LWRTLIGKIFVAAVVLSVSPVRKPSKIEEEAALLLKNYKKNL